MTKWSKMEDFEVFKATLNVTRVLKTDETLCLSGGGRLHFKTVHIDIAEVFHHDCKSIVDQMKEKRLISYLDDFKFLSKS